MATAKNPATHDARRQGGLLSRQLAATTKELVEDALAWTHGNQVKASALLGCNKVSLWAWIQQFQIDLNAVKTAARAGAWEYKSRPVDGAPWCERQK